MATGVTESAAAGWPEHLFRREAGNLVTALAGVFGLHRLEVAEAVVQEALVRALRIWPFHGMPRYPAAWLTQTTKHLALDTIQREANFEHKQQQLIAFMAQWPGRAADSAPLREADIRETRIRLLFACCHPQLSPEAQVALILRVLCGFSAAEIAGAFLIAESAILQRLADARQMLREKPVTLALPDGATLFARREQVLHSLFLLFNEGCKAAGGEALGRATLCLEAIRLAESLVAHPAGDQPRAHALLALMLLNGARLPAPAEGAGNMLRLQEQDRSQWDRGLIARGMFHLARAAASEKLSEYHLQAGIAAVHCAAPSYAATDWAQILELYDQLLAHDDSPHVALNRAVVLAEVAGPQAAIAAVMAIPDLPMLKSHYLLHAVLGELEFRQNNLRAAATYFHTAVQLAEMKSEQLYLTRRLQTCLGQ
ncbi:MAG TPA: sigma factor-like helix-turn-helix DNA-binding protein [Verrucomicrobiota bacterium]|nr:sigma factor-like helix-turn-helix DNA-binding protein [Verrucomicrobiota bacterium]HNT13311.1 sigma factor-like helix-turn-helix DNA-binding protein [Verrucomicrobiota bacterium]